jgi:hypothetical protein
MKDGDKDRARSRERKRGREKERGEERKRVENEQGEGVKRQNKSERE